MKKSIFLVLLTIMIISSNSIVFAATKSDIINSARENVLPDIPADKLSDYPYYLIRYNSVYEYYELYMFETIPVCDVGSDTYLNLPVDWCISYPKLYVDDLSSWGSYGGNTSSITLTYGSSSDDIETCVVYSNFDIKDTDGKTYYLAYEINSAIPEEDDDSGFWSSLFNRLADGFSSVIDVIVGISQAILDGLSNLFELLFVPQASRNLFDEVQVLFESKFGVFSQLRDLVESILSPDFYDGTPKFEITYKGSTYEIIDFDIISPYRTFIQNVTGFLMIFSTLLWLIKNASTIIHDGSASSESVKE